MNPARSQPLHTASEVRALIAASGDPSLQKRFGLSDAMLDDPDSKISLVVLHELIEAAVEATGDDYFGLHFGDGLGRAEFAQRLGAVGLLMLVSPDIGTGMGHLIRYHGRFGEGDRSEFVQRGDLTHLFLTTYGEQRPATIHMAEKTIAQMLSIFRIVEPPLEPVAIHFAHPSRAGNDELVRVLGIEPSNDAEHTSIVVQTEHLKRPIQGADPDVFAYLERNLRDTRESPILGTDEGEVSRQARAAITSGLQNGKHSSAWVADALGCSLRSVQRSLAAENTSLSQLLTEVRQQRAKGLLGSDISIGDIAFLLGYSATDPFVRAFIRWFGVTPREWRDREARK